MEQRLLLDRIDVCGGDPFRKRHESAVTILAHTANASETGSDATPMRAQITANAAVRLRLPEDGFERLVAVPWCGFS